MNFFKKKFIPWSLAWIIQRTLVVIIERRRPDIKLFRFRRNKAKAIKKSGFYSPDQLIKIRYRNGLSAFDEFLLGDMAGSFGSFNVITTGEQKEVINEYFDRIYIISHRKRSDYLLKIVQKLRSLNIEATVIELEGSDADNDHPDFLFYQNTAPGYLDAYKKLISDADQNKYSRILCLEDSVVFARDFHEKFRNALISIPGDWKLLALGTIPGRMICTSEEAGSGTCTWGAGITPTYALGIDNSLFKPLMRELLMERKPQDRDIWKVLSEANPEKCCSLVPNLIIPATRPCHGDMEILIRGLLQKYDLAYDSYDHSSETEKVSVIMPAYNAANTVRQSIDSVLNQSYSNIELIISDDGSHDHTRDVVKEFMQVDSRVFLIEHKVNRGCYFMRNEALKLSVGSYIAVQDSDDISFSRRIEKQLIPIVSGNAMFTLTWILRSRLRITDFNIKDETGMIKKALDNRQLSPDSTYGYWDKPILGFMTSLYARSLFEDFGLFWEHRFGADAEFFERILFHKTGKIIAMDEPNVHTFLRSTSSVPGIYRRIEEILLISAEMNAMNITNTYKKEALNTFIQNYRQKFSGNYLYDYPTL